MKMNYLTRDCAALGQLVLVLIVVLTVVVLVVHIVKLVLGKEYKDLVWPVFVATVPIVVTQVYTKAISDAEIRVEYIQIAVDILNGGPSNKEGPQPGSQEDIRKWAVKLINHYSPVKMDEATKRAIIYGSADIHEKPDTGEGTGTTGIGE
jgi:hypothetical protein